MHIKFKPFALQLFQYKIETCVGVFTFVTGARHFAVPASRENPRDAAPGAAPAQAAGTFSPARRRLRVLQLLHRPASTARRRTRSTQVLKFSHVKLQWRIICAITKIKMIKSAINHALNNFGKSE